MAARKRLKKKAVEVVQTVPLRHRFPEDDDPSPYHDGRDPDAADEDSDDEEEPTWADYKETFYEVVVQYPMEQHRNAQQLRALDEKLMDDVSLLRRECETYVRAAGKGRKQVLDRLRAGAGELVERIKQRRLDESASQTPIGSTTSRGETVEGVGLVAPEAAELPQLLDEPSLMPVVDTSAASPAWENGNAVASSSRLGAFNHTSAPVQVEPVLPSQAARRPPSFAAILALRRQNPITASEKISLATDAYDKTDRHIRTLDSELEAHTLAGRHVPDLNKSGAGVGPEHESIELDDDDDDEGSVLEVQARPARSKKVNGGPSSKKSSSDKFLDMGRDGGDDVDTSGLTGEAKVRAALSAPGVVLLPGEPNYCFCNLPSWGKMLGCDNNDCEREWFHPDCLGFSQTEIPTGEWYCPECRPLFKNNGQRAKKRRLI